MTNYIPDTNSFSLAGPPAWFLSKLWDFDPSLVIVPSRQGFYYRLAQRRKLQLSDKVVNEALFAESDTKMLASYSLVPVTTILATANWTNPYIFVELANRAPWRQGGAAKVIQRLEDADWKAELDRRAATNEHLEHLGKDGYNYYKMKLGLRSHLWSPKTPTRGLNEHGGTISGPLLKAGQL